MWGFGTTGNRKTLVTLSLYLLSVCVAMLLLSGVLIHFANRNLHNEIYRDRLQQLKLVQQTLDARIHNETFQFVLDRYFVDRSSDRIVHALDDGIRTLTPFELYALADTLRAYLAGHLLVADVGVANLVDGTVVSACMGLVQDPDTGRPITDSLPWILGQIASAPGTKGVIRDENSNQLVVFYRYASLGAVSHRTDGAILFFISDDSLRRLIHSFPILTNSTVTIGNENTMLFWSSKTPPTSEARKNAGIIDLPSAFEGLNYQVIFPTDVLARQVAVSRNAMVLLTLALLVPALLSFAVFLSRTLTPVGKLLSFIAIRFPNITDREDTMKSVEPMLERHLSQYSVLLEQKLVHDLVSGRPVASAELKEQAKLCNKTLTDLPTVVMLVSIELDSDSVEPTCGTPDRDSTGGSFLVPFTLMSRVDEFAERRGDLYALRATDGPGDLLILLQSASFAINDFSLVRELAGTLRESAESIPLTICFTQPAVGPLELFESRTKLEELRRYAFVYGHDRVIDSDLIRTRTDDVLATRGQSLLGDLRRSLSADPRAAVAGVREMKVMLFASGTIEEVNDYLAAIVRILVEFDRATLFGAVTSTAEMNAVLENSQRLSHFMRYVEKTIADLSGELVRLRDAERGEFISGILEYIKRNLGPTISLMEVADHFHVSPEYMSRSFSKSLGISFGQFVRDLKISRAAALIANDALPLGEIAGQLGYSSPGYLARIFRERYGVSPSEYREQSRRDTAAAQ